jgi:hypothetical protein
LGRVESRRPSPTKRVLEFPPLLATTHSRSADASQGSGARWRSGGLAKDLLMEVMPFLEKRFAFLMRIEWALEG